MDKENYQYALNSPRDASKWMGVHRSGLADGDIRGAVPTASTPRVEGRHLHNIDGKDAENVMHFTSIPSTGKNHHLKAASKLNYQTPKASFATPSLQNSSRWPRILKDVTNDEKSLLNLDQHPQNLLRSGGTGKKSRISIHENHAESVYSIDKATSVSPGQSKLSQIVFNATADSLPDIEYMPKSIPNTKSIVYAQEYLDDLCHMDDADSISLTMRNLLTTSLTPTLPSNSQDQVLDISFSCMKLLDGTDGSDLGNEQCLLSPDHPMLVKPWLDESMDED
jgi:hypothetical protein